MRDTGARDAGEVRSLVRCDRDRVGLGLLPVGLVALLEAPLRAGWWSVPASTRASVEVAGFAVAVLVFCGLVLYSVREYGPTPERVPMGVRAALGWACVSLCFLVPLVITVIWGAGLLAELAILPAAAAVAWMLLRGRPTGVSRPHRFVLAALFAVISTMQVATGMPIWRDSAGALLVLMGVTFPACAIVEEVRTRQAYGSAL